MHAMPPVPALYFPALDGLRFFAFLLVFVHHLPRTSVPILALLHDQGWVGVHIFLLLSAYLLTTILRAERAANGKISVVLHVDRDRWINPLSGDEQRFPTNVGTVRQPVIGRRHDEADFNLVIESILHGRTRDPNVAAGSPCRGRKLQRVIGDAGDFLRIFPSIADDRRVRAIEIVRKYGVPRTRFSSACEKCKSKKVYAYEVQP